MKFLIPIFFVFSALPLFADEEIEVMQELILASQKNLRAQKELLTSLVKFKKARQAFVGEPTSRKLATDLVKASLIVQKQIENENLTHLFSSDFLTEIHFFNQVAKQQKP